jgi:hypothetical protein
MSIEKQLNIELRSRILEYSLVIENSINDLLLLNLGLFNDKRKTKLFSNKGKISFQNKVDLLDDIEVLSPDENLEFGLLMNIRNKFLHDLECNSFKILFNNDNLKDKGIRNRFKKFLNEGQLISDEEACKKACYRLFQKNIKTIKNKISVNKAAINKKHEFFQIQNEQKIFYIDFIHDLMNEVSIATENSELENPKVTILGTELLQILKKAIHRLNIQSEIEKKNQEEFFNSDDNIKATFGVKGDLKDWPKWEDFKLPIIIKSKIQ